MQRVDSLEKSDAGRDWGQEEKGTTEDEMAGWHHQLNGHEFEWTPGVGDGQGGLACCDSWDRRVGHDWATELNWNEHCGTCVWILFFGWFFYFNFYFILLYNTVLVMPYIDMNPPWVHMNSQTWTPLPPPSPYNLSGSSPCTSPKHPVSCIKHRLAIHFLHDSIYVSTPFSQIIPPSPSPSESKSPLYISVSLLLSRIQGHHYHLSKFHIYVLVYCIGVFLSGLLHSV